MQEIELLAQIDNIPLFTEFVDEVLDSLECPMKTRVRIDVMLDEIISNVSFYAYGGEIGKLKIGIEGIPGEKVVMTFADSGTPYNPLEKEDPDVTAALEDRKIGGLGIYIVKKTMDEVSYQFKDGYNILTVLKNFK